MTNKEHLEIEWLIGSETKLEELTKADHVELAWLLGMSTFLKLARRMGMYEKEIEYIANRVQFKMDQ